jgi:hypothetical protein
VDESFDSKEYFCQQPAAGATGSAKDFACTSIKCITQRPVETADSIFDQKFAPLKGTPAVLKVAAGQGTIYF